MNQLMFLPYVFIGGGFGASLRWGVSLMITSMNFPVWYATAIVNLLGTVIFCASFKFFPQGDVIPHHLLRVGILGSLTTFSTFSYELALLIKQGQYGTSLLVLLLNVFAGILIAVGLLR